MNFVVGDIVKGVSNKYCITDTDMTRARVLAIHDNVIEICVMSHKRNPSYFGESYVVKAKYFEKIGHIKPFNREEVLELIAKSNQNKINEYDFYGADLSGANLRNTNLRNTNLSGADLSGADLMNANLRYADLRNTNLSDANLMNANLMNAKLSDANLMNADLMNVRYNECTGFFALVCPEEGSFIGYKKANGHIVKLRITEDALRSSATSRKCRCSKAEVLSITTLSGEDDGTISIKSNYDSNFIYRVGTIVEVKDFEVDRWIECAAGIHFFITRQEAVQY